MMTVMNPVCHANKSLYFTVYSKLDFSNLNLIVNKLISKFSFSSFPLKAVAEIT